MLRLIEGRIHSLPERSRYCPADCFAVFLKTRCTLLLPSHLSCPRVCRMIWRFASFYKQTCYCEKIRPRFRRDYPLNLSILLSGGKETNKDSPSNGE
jgi:hypothetical protein